MKLAGPLFILVWLFSLAAAARPLVADLSQYRIAIDSGFTGTQLLLFGARNDPGDIVVAVRGPERTVLVRRKARIAGIWVNREEERFRNIPSYYSLASSRPLENIRDSGYFVPLHVGLDNAVAQAAPKPEFAAALIAQEQRQHLYPLVPGQVSFMGDSLFKYSIPFPDNIPGGDYSANVYLFRDGQLMGMQSIPIHVEKIGFDAFVSDVARAHSVLYGLTAVLIALVIGWGAGSLMQRV